MALLGFSSLVGHSMELELVIGCEAAHCSCICGKAFNGYPMGFASISRDESKYCLYF